MDEPRHLLSLAVVWFCLETIRKFLPLGLRLRIDHISQQDFACDVKAGFEDE